MKRSSDMDIEKRGLSYAHLSNTSIRSFAWEGANVSVKDRKIRRDILTNVDGMVRAGELLAIMGPSGCGKTTLLNVLANRAVQSGTSVRAKVELNGHAPPSAYLRRISSYVEQEDALLGSLTVKETIEFAGRLSLPASVSKSERLERVQALLTAFGLEEQSQTLVGTPIRKGISGGQKRRLSVASQLITSPKLLFLDEPTSGLDSAASYEVISFIKNIAKENNLLVVASIHQPSTSTFNMFDKLLLLSRGRTAYCGPVSGVQPHFNSLGFEMPTYTNPGEFVVDLVNTDFARDQSAARERLDNIHTSWVNAQKPAANVYAIEESSSTSSDQETDLELSAGELGSATAYLIPLTLMHRSLIKSYRDVFAYGIRIAMYMALAIMMGTVWLRLDTNQSSIQSFINAIFFGGAFMSFMAVAYIPAYLEDRALFMKERANGLYGPLSFMVANFLIGLPYLFLICILFSVIAYWLTGFRPTADGFWTWVMWLFLDLVAAESLVVLISSLVPIFIVALAATAFANGLWMSVGGFLVPPNILNVFWRYVFHYIDYQAYVFQGMMVNEFASRTYDCGTDCQCMYTSDLAPQCKIAGRAVLDSYGYETGKTGKWVGILIGIVVGYRVLGLVVLYLRRT